MRHTIDQSGRKTTEAWNLDVQLLADFLRDKSGLVSYPEISAVLGRDVQGAAWHVLAGARKSLERDGIVFGTVRGAGINRLTDDEIVGTGRDALSRIRRSSRRAINRLACADYGKLSNDGKVKHNTYASMLGALNQATKEPQIRKVEAAVTTAQAKLPLAKTLDAFKGEGSPP